MMSTSASATSDMKAATGSRTNATGRKPLMANEYQVPERPLDAKRVCSTAC